MSNPVLAAVGVDDGSAVARLLSCPDCGELLWRSQFYWSCPRGHGRLICGKLLAAGLRDLDRERFGRLRGAERFLRRFQSQQARSLLPPPSK